MLQCGGTNIYYSAVCEDIMCISKPQPVPDSKSSMASRDPTSATLLEAQRSPSNEGVVTHALAALWRKQCTTAVLHLHNNKIIISARIRGNLLGGGGVSIQC